MAMSEKSQAKEEEISLVMDSIYQIHHWDCGIACAQMALSLISPELRDADFEEILQRLGIGHSVWTIDLAQIMHHLRVKAKLTTVTLGVDPTYSDVDFYTNRIDARPFSDEEKRVNDLFARAAEIGLQVEKRSVATDEIVQHLSARNPAIVLIDASILRCLVCDIKDSASTRWNGRPQPQEYQGHFIVLSGCNSSKEQLFYKNPTYYKGVCIDCCCTFKNFNAARRSHGTDEDILFVFT